ncbi:MAG: UDP-N-acetylmuramate--L-alanine ligase [Candidatus Tectomicrobia bacterium]|nr:UDP-N-acetylmuramate--L-alanine ligase [Candidatus Tectomicrobia bacterium]
MFHKVRKVHFVGIGGIGMSGIAEVLLTLGFRVSGSDLQESPSLRRLERLGARCRVGHQAENLGDCEVVVYSSAVPLDNPELAAARQLHLPVIRRAEMLAELMRLKYSVAVAGTHGKTTTTSLISTVLAHAGLDPTAIIGGRLNSLQTNSKLGEGEYLVAEADESDGSFLKLFPTCAVVTNIDADHLDYYRDLEQIKQAFLEFINKVPFYGFAVLCFDHKVIQSLLPQVERRCITYGLNPQADYSAHDLLFSGARSRFVAYRGAAKLGEVEVALPGAHNVCNALATLAVALELDVPFAVVQQALRDFGGIQRRFEIKGVRRDIMVVDDYGHHPREIEATLTAAKGGWEQKRLVVAFQPHRYSRTQALFAEFCTAFYQADVLLLTDIYSAGEAPIAGVSGARLAEGLREHGHRNVTYLASREEVLATLQEIVRPGDLVLTLGAGNIYSVGNELIAWLENDEAAGAGERPPWR